MELQIKGNGHRQQVLHADCGVFEDVMSPIGPRKRGAFLPLGCTMSEVEFKSKFCFYGLKLWEP